MKKKLSILLVGTLLSSLLIFTGCGGEETAGDAVYKHESRTFMLGDWEITTTNDEVKYDEVEARDNFVLYFTAVNKSDEVRIFSNTDNIHGKQNAETLYWGALQNEDGDYIASDYTILDQEVESGDSVDLIFIWALDDDSPVTVVFQGYTVDIESTEIVYEIADRITDDWKNAQDAAAADLKEKMSVTSFDIAGVSGDLTDGWYIDESYDSSVTLAREGESGYLDIEVSSLKDSAQSWAEDIASNYNMDASSITTVTVGSTEYICFEPLEDQVYLFMDSSEGVVTISTMFYTFADITAQIEALTFK